MTNPKHSINSYDNENGLAYLFTNIEGSARNLCLQMNLYWLLNGR